MKYGDVPTWTLHVKGAFQVPKGMTEDQFLARLYSFLESFGAGFGGETRPDPYDAP